MELSPALEFSLLLCFVIHPLVYPNSLHKTTFHISLCLFVLEPYAIKCSSSFFKFAQLSSSKITNPCIGAIIVTMVEYAWFSVEIDRWMQMVAA